MKYLLQKKKIDILSKDDFNPEHILECGQVFSYDKTEKGYIVYPQNHLAKIVENEKGYIIFCDDEKYFENYFDLKTDYGKIKKVLSKFDILQKPMQFGYGIRILRQDLFEMLISFIISANNNIKRIKLILKRLRDSLGEKGEISAFPSLKVMREKGEDFYKAIGAGYRAKYLAKVVHQIEENTLENWKSLDTPSLRKKLLSLCGVGPKVADCILLFGYGRNDVFPVDTWIKKMYNEFYSPLENREKIRENLLGIFGELSGIAQQYLFYYQRSASH